MTRRRRRAQGCGCTDPVFSHVPQPHRRVLIMRDASTRFGPLHLPDLALVFHLNPMLLPLQLRNIPSCLA